MKSDHYILVIDKDRDTIYNIMKQAARSNPMFLPSLVNLGLEKAYKELSDEVIKKTHEAEFCSDPNCQYPK